MKKHLEYLLSVLIPGVLFGIIGYFIGISIDFYCPCGICDMGVREAGLYTGIIGFSSGLILGALIYLYWTKKQKR